jgi:nitroreductase/NAD-dependent dihydropyrimidine dehydrogenase PreA subunit
MAETTFRTGIGNRAATPTIDAKTCDLCGLCVKVCGTGLRIKGDAVVFDDDALAGCIGCGQCMAVCPTGSITVTGRKMSPDDRLTMPAPDDCATPEQLESLLLRRRSVRIYSDREVEKPVVDRILRIASTAPMGIPPSDVGVIVVSGRKKIKELRDDLIDYFKSLSKYFNRGLLLLMRPFMKKASYEMLRDFVGPLLKEYYDARERGSDVLFYDCPLVLLFHSGPYSDPADSYIAATYAMIAAESLGLGTCMNGMIPIMGYSKKLKRKYGIPKGDKVYLGIMMGYPAVKYQRALRREFASATYR